MTMESANTANSQPAPLAQNSTPHPCEVNQQNEKIENTKSVLLSAGTGPGPGSGPGPFANSTSNTQFKKDSKLSVATGNSARSHKDYIDSLATPTPDEVRKIGEAQERKEVEVIKKRLSMQADNGGLNDEERQKAAELIQRNYRGHRERRMLNGLSLDPSTRWVEAVKEARYRLMTEPRSRESNDATRRSMDGAGSATGSGSGVDGGYVQSPFSLGAFPEKPTFSQTSLEL
jgi:hypothetical protein